jgi:hypothetical protein
LTVGTTITSGEINGLTVSFVRGTGNTVVGNAAGTTLGTSAQYNVLVGLNAGDAISSGDRNIGIGKDAIGLLSTTADNIAIGYQAGDALTTGSTNVAIGSDALGAAQTTTGCVAVGHNALLLNTTSNIVAIGSLAMAAHTSGLSNLGIGYRALQSITTGTNCIAVGENALRLNTVDGNTAFGGNALQSCTTGTGNTAIGASSLGNIGIGINNVGIGQSTLRVGTSCQNNMSIGTASLYNHTTGHNNVAIGTYSMFQSTNSGGCVGIGNGALGGGSASAMSTQGSVAIGQNSLQSLTTGWYNCGVGTDSLFSITTQSSMTAIGAFAAKFQADGATALTTAASSVYIGYNSRGTQTDSNTIVIGKDAISLGANTTAIGTSSTLGNRIFGVASTGQVAPTIASAGTIAPTKTITFISGTAAIATITAPSTIATTGGQITLIPTGIFTTTAAGNIALASTAVVSKALIMTYDATTTKWYPSY